MQRYPIAQAVYQHPLLDITKLSSLQASDASRLLWLNQRKVGAWRQEPTPSIPLHTVPRAAALRGLPCTGISADISHCASDTEPKDITTKYKPKECLCYMIKLLTACFSLNETAC